MSQVLEVRGLRKSFKTGLLGKKTEVLKGLDFTLEKGKVTGFLGANGAGKTTTIKCLLDLIYPTAGEIRLFGEKPNREARQRIGFLPERPYFYDYLSGFEFLKFYGQLSTDLRPIELKKRIEELLERVKLSHAGKRYLRDYSKGMLQRIGVAQALIHRPEFVILDEPMSGLDPDGRFEVSQIIEETASEGTTIFFSSHLLNDVEKLCENLFVIKGGEKVFSGTTEELLSQVSSGHVLVYAEAGEKKSLAVETSNLNSEIDNLRGRGLEILEIKSERPSLEEAFVQIAYDKGAR